MIKRSGIFSKVVSPLRRRFSSQTVCAVLAFFLGVGTVPAAEPSDGWFDFNPPTDDFSAGSVIDLRYLNENEAGDGGFIAVKDGHFIHSKTGEPVRFWALNGPSSSANTKDGLRREARLLAKYGVNLVRIHGAVFDKYGEPDLKRIRHIQEIVAAMKAEGIYSHLSIYFPLWFDPKPDNPFLTGYNGNQHPFAALEFNPEFQKKYHAWWRALLLAPDPETGGKLVDDPAVFGVEMQNEDSYFFWTFSDRNLPDAQLRILEKRFGDWLIKKYGSLDSAFKAWNGAKIQRDDPDSGRVGFRPLWNIFNEKTRRDQDTAAFLLESQTRFYRETYQFVKSLGFKGLMTASNWTTASAEVLGPLEELSYRAGDFIDRHGYFSCNHKGDNSAWSIRNGQTYSDRSALRFDPETPGKPKQFVHPAMDIKYNGLPSMISETTWTRPNRYRSEAPLYLAAFGALQDSDAIVHFAFDGSTWNVKPNFWMQPWTLMSPSMMGQFPAAALIYRQGLISSGKVLADVRLNIDDLKALKGTPLPQGAAFDELRAKDVPAGTEVKPGQVIDPLIHYAGQTRVTFTDDPEQVDLKNLTPYIDRAKQVVHASNGQLQLSYGPGVILINAPGAQGASGNLAAPAKWETDDLEISSPLDLVHVVVVTLDEKPIAKSERMLLQVMSEERTTGFQKTSAGQDVWRIENIGTNPWQVKNLAGEVRFKRPDAAGLKIQPLDLTGRPTGNSVAGGSIELKPATVYYLIETK